MVIFPNFRGENSKKYLKPPPSSQSAHHSPPAQQLQQLSLQLFESAQCRYNLQLGITGGSSPRDSMGRTVYLPIHEWLIFMVNVYNIPVPWILWEWDGGMLLSLSGEMNLTQKGLLRDFMYETSKYLKTLDSC